MNITNVKIGAEESYGFLCIPQNRLLCKGVFNGDNPFKFIGPIFLAQLAIGAFFTSACQFLLRPLGQANIVGQILGGIIAGPSVLGQNKEYMETIFPGKSMNLMKTISLFACMTFVFLVGVRMDVDVVKRSGNKEWAIGIITFLLPMLISVPTSFLFHRFTQEKSKLDIHAEIIDGELQFIAILCSITSFHDISCVLHDLKLLNSEIGRIATSSSMISGMLGWFTLMVAFTVKQSVKVGLGLGPCFLIFASMGVAIIILVYGIKPMVVWMINQTPDGKPIKEIYVIIVFLIFLFCAFLSQLNGQLPFFMPMFLGLIIPAGPPLGSTVVDTIDCFVSYIMLPLYFLLNGGEVQLSGISSFTWWVIATLSLNSALGKFVGTLLPCVYYQMPFVESLSLALLLCAVGLVDLLAYTRSLYLGYITSTSFSIMSIMAPIITGVVSFTVKYLYDPSRRYESYRRRTIEHTHSHSELRILVCINNQESVPTILNILEASNPTRESPLGVYVLHLFELVGRASPLLVAHQTSGSKGKGLNHKSNHTQRIMNAFKIFENNNQGIVFVQFYTCIAPYSTMHEDICTVALDKYTSLLILHFHKFWSSEGVMVESAGLRNANKRVLKKSPCSVAILVDLGAFGRPRSIHESWSFYRIGLIFIGGADDREALFYAIRMVAHPNVKLTVVRFIEATQDEDRIDGVDQSIEMKLDCDLINEFRVSFAHVNMGRVSYMEEVIKDSLDTKNVIQSMGDSSDLILTGRRHQSNAYSFRGIKERMKFPELGRIGDMLASNVYKTTVSLLVVQQHNFSKGEVEREGPRLVLDISNSNKTSKSYCSEESKEKSFIDDFKIAKREQ
ncbi:cation/H(+) antiporter 15-like [Telopea speciosissima]|uniref:cation/H(+) antiporter 15-like n=1 Tax=Telopea speciosissima TaxID=54955 RepID=UPI001CC4872F|nr:cation/H(+) antiporter 15-like [Telopea speciosissima]